MITRASAHALRAMIELAKLGAGERLNAIALAKSTGATVEGMRKTFKALRRSKLVISKSGRRDSGWCLARGANEITALDVIRAIEAAEDAKRNEVGSRLRIADLDRRRDGMLFEVVGKLGEMTLAEYL